MLQLVYGIDFYLDYFNATKNINVGHYLKLLVSLFLSSTFISQIVKPFFNKNITCKLTLMFNRKSKFAFKGLFERFSNEFVVSILKKLG